MAFMPESRKWCQTESSSTLTTLLFFFQVDEWEKIEDLNTTKSLWADNGPTLNAELIAL